MIKLFREEVFVPGTHYAGWNWVLQNLRETVHQQTGAGLFLDDFVDISFGSNYEAGSRSGDLPYTHPWIGIVHHPIHLPHPFKVAHGAGIMAMRQNFIQSLACCRGLITFSNDLARDLSTLLSEYPINATVPVLALKHPTPLDVPQWDPARFEEQPSIHSCGHWLRRLESLARLPLARKKYYLFTSPDEKITNVRAANLDAAMRAANIYQEGQGDFTVLPHLNNRDYDDLLTRSAGFLDLLACSASNTILEHIARACPLAVNRLPAVVEYLGPEYPLYYESLEQCAAKLGDSILLRDTHSYLKTLPRHRFGIGPFIDSMKGAITLVKSKARA